MRSVHHFTKLAIFGVLVGLSLGTPARAGDPVTRPFKMTATTTWDDLRFAFNPAKGTSFNDGAGTSTVLGKFTATGRMFATEEQPRPNGDVPVAGKVTYVAANGDELYADFLDGKVNIVTGLGEAQYEFTGGTGRFENASGTGEVWALFDTQGSEKLDDVHMDVIWLGDITF